VKEKLVAESGRICGSWNPDSTGGCNSGRPRHQLQKVRGGQPVHKWRNEVGVPAAGASNLSKASAHGVGGGETKGKGRIVVKRGASKRKRSAVLLVRKKSKGQSL